MGDSLAGLVLVVSSRGTCDDRTIDEQLRAAGLSVRPVCDVPSAMRCLEEARAHVLVLAPDAAGDGEELDTLARVRRSGFLGMILVVGRSSDRSATVNALDHGADDYVVLSCDPTELLARVRALVRRSTGVTAFEREIDGLVLDLRRGVIRCHDVEVALTRRESDLLEYLTRNAGHPVSREELAAHIWHAAAPSNGGTNIVDVYVSYVRRKLGTLGRQSLIRSVRGVGYELVTTGDRTEPSS
jgi:two-component system copper resistance phosphate regulon response regulator CusR